MSAIGHRTPKDSNPADVAREMFSQAKAAALQHVESLQAAIARVHALSNEIAGAADIYPWPIKDFSRRLGEDLLWRENTVGPR